MSEKYHVIGLMSGTSLDGLDIAYVEFSEEADRWHYKIIKAESIGYDDSWRRRLAEAIHHENNELALLDKRYGQWLGRQIKEFLSRHGVNVDLVSSHGHTVFHDPDRGITRQIGDGQDIANLVGLRTVCDFRSGDVELGGQGAPLVPIGDQLLFPEYAACLNLGGIANISFASKGERIAFDLGMANLPLNHYARELGLDYDEGGNIAARGRLNTELFKALNELEYYRRKPPKSLGLEWFLEIMLPLVDTYDIAVADKLATLVHHEARQIAEVIRKAGITGEILVTGGGALNDFFIKKIKHYLGKGVSLILPSRQLIEYKEALIFALMGVLRLRNEVNCLKSVTGAREDSSAGKVFNPRLT
jgi:anhydro-N-acetylmuramic acid kinase